MISVTSPLTKLLEMTLFKLWEGSVPSDKPGPKVWSTRYVVNAKNKNDAERIFKEAGLGISKVFALTDDEWLASVLRDHPELRNYGTYAKWHDVEVRGNTPKQREPKVVSAHNIYIVWGENGRHNGWAVINAPSAAAAKQLARSDWLEFGKVTGIQTLEGYLEERGDSLEDFFIEYPNSKTPGSVEEIEWGT